MPRTSLQLRSKITSNAQLELCLVPVEVADPGPDEVVVRIEAAPINPSDLGLLFGPADMRTAKASGSASHPLVTADVPADQMRGVAARVDQSLPVGNEGAGVVVAAGESPAAQALLGRTVGVIGGAMYAQLRSAKLGQCLAFPDGTRPSECASWFVNPLTALGMVETMRKEGFTALVHTAAASNLGQMLVKLCLADGVPLVNIVRKPEQAALLRSQGAKLVVDTSAPDFEEALLAAIDATGATIAFDAVGGGRLAGQILSAMEASLARKMTAFSPYGSPRHKQVYSYGLLDGGPAVLERGRFGMAWSFGGWLLTYFLEKAGAETVQRLKQRVASNLKTTFASAYTKDVSLAQALSREEIAIYSKRATAAKYLVCPNKDLCS